MVHLVPMKRATILLIFLAVCLVNLLQGQTPCSNLGQNPGTAFPVCGSTNFEQATVPICGGRTVPGPCNEVILEDRNPFWYKFTCYRAGTLGLEITPNLITDDYDWQIFDVTGKNVEDVFTDEDLFVACNWSGYGGVTGASEEGTSLISCSGDNPIWSAMPTLQEGHEYLLLVSHFSPGQSGYSLSFKGGTAGITDDVPAAVESTEGMCTGNSLYIKLDKPVKCSSIAEDGTDFSISGAGAARVVSASSALCSGAFTTDSIVVYFDQTIPQGSYSVQIKQGSDGNTLLNNCDVEMIPANRGFRIYEAAVADFTYELKTGCKRDTVHFSHNGAHGVNKWTWAFDESGSIEQNPSIIFTTTGSKTATLVAQNDHCADTASITIELPEKIAASFTGPEITCSKDPVVFTNTSTGNIVSQVWDFGLNEQSNVRQPEPFNYPFNTGEKRYRVLLTVHDDAGCYDTAAANLLVVGNCNIVVPSAFTPNRDGRNDELYPSNAFNADALIFRVYDRFGKIMFETRDWTRKWDGTLNGIAQPAGTYVWTLSYRLRTTGTPYFFKGTTTLLR